MIWLAMGAVDYFRVSNFERPAFCLLDVENSYEDGGSGTYKGLGYSFDITGICYISLESALLIRQREGLAANRDPWL